MRKKRAILYDDEPMILSLLSEILSFKDYNVLTFSEPRVCPLYDDTSGNCENSLPCADIFITDLIMPGMNGLDLLRQQEDRGCKIDCKNKAVISGTVTSDHKKMIADMNVRYFHKPFALSEIENWLDECEQRIDLTKELFIKRKYDRSPSRIKIKYELPSHERKFEGIVTNISKGGFCLTTFDPIVKEELVVIDTELPAACQEATVRWVTIHDDSSFTAGLSCH